MKKLLKIFTITIGIALIGWSCSEDRLEPVLTVAPGGGLVSQYTAYTIDSVAGQSSVYGRVVFWLDNAGNTLIQLALHNTSDGGLHPSSVFGGSITVPGAELMVLDDVDGDKGEFISNKFFVISDETFYANLDSYDAHINIYRSSTDMTIIATGDIGLNADPVETN